jgi:glycosyltransferase involved in cell wall biosynthesis
MKVVHVPFCYAPDPMGGTEVYVENLARDLEAFDIGTVVVAPSDSTRAYTINNVRVCRYAVSDDVTDLAQLYGMDDPLAASEFAKILDEEMPDLVHLHAFTRGVSLRLVQAAKQRGIPVVFTYHTPTVSCQRGTLMLRGAEVCDGRLDVARCASCTLDGLGLTEPLADMIGRMPTSWGRWLGNRGLQSGPWTALRMSELICVRHAAFRNMMAGVDHIVAVCEWVQEVLILNNVPPSKISLSRHGIRWEPTSGKASSNNQTRIAFVGRFDQTKGLHVLIEAFLAAPTMQVQLDVYGIAQSPANVAYQKKMQSLANGDSRIAFRGPIPTGETVPRLREYDFLAVPSQTLETGPLVVLEAFAAGIPVIGLDLGGIAELVEQGVNGLLLETNSVAIWAEVLQQVANDADLRARLKAGVRPPRSSIEVARDMQAIYRTLLEPEVKPRAEPVAICEVR